MPKRDFLKYLGFHTAATITIMQTEKNQRPIPLEIDQIFSKAASDFVNGGISIADYSPLGIANFSYYQGRMDEYFRLSAPASPAEEKPEDIQQWIKREMAEYSDNENEQISFYDGFEATYKKTTEELAKVKDELRVCIRERNKYLYQLDTLTESKPSPVIEELRKPKYAHHDCSHCGGWLIYKDDRWQHAPDGWEPEASHPAPALIVGERDKTEEDRVKSGNKLLDMIDELLTPPALTEQALPEEINARIENEIKSHGINVEMFHGIGAKKVAIAMYRKMQEEMGQVIENAVAFSRLSVKQANELVELKETLRIAQQNESSYRVWLEESGEESAHEKEKLGWEIVALSERLSEAREQLTSARALITKIKRWDVYQDAADECDKWLNGNPEGKP